MDKTFLANYKDVFVHVTNLDAVGGYLQEGQAVSFEVQQGKKGLEAINVESA